MTSKYVESQWHFERLSEDDRAKVREWMEEKKLDEIKDLYVESKAAPATMGNCPFCDDTKEIHNWTKWAIGTGKI